SPWRQGGGRFEIVGTWEELRTGGEGGRTLQGLELRRLSQPDGALLGRVELRSILTGPPCWLPGPGARVPPTELDGSLAYHDFDEEGDGPPKPLAWAPEGPSPYGGRFIAFDLARIGGETDGDDGEALLIAALQPQSQGFAPTERGIVLWW